MFAYEVMSRRPISTNMLARTGSRRRSEMRAATWLPTEIPSREPSSRAPTMDQSTLPMRAHAGHKGEGHRMCKVGADDADGRQPRIEKKSTATPKAPAPTEHSDTSTPSTAPNTTVIGPERIEPVHSRYNSALAPSTNLLSWHELMQTPVAT